jgi:hypothetical protein
VCGAGEEAAGVYVEALREIARGAGSKLNRCFLFLPEPDRTQSLLLLRQIEHGFEIQPQCRVGLSNRALRVASLVRASHSTSKHSPLFLHALYDSADDELCMHRDQRHEGCSPSSSN